MKKVPQVITDNFIHDVNSQMAEVKQLISNHATENNNSHTDHEMITTEKRTVISLFEHPEIKNKNKQMIENLLEHHIHCFIIPS